MAIVKREDKFNSSDGLARQAPNVKVTGTRLVAQVMTRAERGQPEQDQQDRDRTGVAFTRMSAEMSKNTVKND